MIPLNKEDKWSKNKKHQLLNTIFGKFYQINKVLLCFRDWLVLADFLEYQIQKQRKWDVVRIKRSLKLLPNV